MRINHTSVFILINTVFYRSVIFSVSVKHKAKSGVVRKTEALLKTIHLLCQDMCVFDSQRFVVFAVIFNE